jgi:hypothetical protein
MTTNIVTTQTIFTANAVATAAKTTYSDNTNAVLLLTAGGSGGALYGLTAMPQGVLAAATKVMLFRSRNAGTTLFYVKSVVLPAYAADVGTAAPVQIDFGYTNSSPLRLGGGELLYVGIFTADANGIVFDAQYENL